MSIGALLDQLASQGVQLWFEGSRLRFRGPRGALSTDQRAQLVERRGEAIAALRERAAAELRIAPLSYGQRSLWFINQDEPESAAYHVAFAVRIESAVDRTALQDAFQALVDRHAILRTTYEIVDGQPSQRAAGAGVAAFEVQELPGVDDAVLKARVEADYRRPFDLLNGPVLRTTLYSRAAEDHVLLIAAHHIALDGRAMQVLLEELRALYVESTAGAPAALPRPEVQYTDFADWQAQMLADAEGEKLARYWLAKLAAPRSDVELPSDRPRPKRKSVRGATFDFQLDAVLTQRLAQLARDEGTTLFVVTLAAFKVLLFRYSGTEDIVVGTPTLGRSKPEFGRILGHFVNAVPLRSRLDAQTSFRELTASLRQTLIEALEGQEYPFSLMVERLQPRRDPSRSPLFETMFALQRLDQRQTIDSPLAAGPQDASSSFSLKVRAYDLNQGEGQFDLSLELVDCGDTLDAAFKYNTDLFDVTTIRQLAGHYSQLLSAIVEQPQARIGALPLLSAAERRQVNDAFNATAQAFDATPVMVQVERQAARTPEACAVAFEGETLTYGVLNARANQVAHRLRQVNVGPGVLVGVCMERSPALVVALLGIHKAGGAYVPLDPGFPAERLSFMLADSGAPVLLAAGENARGIAVPAGVQGIDLAAEGAALAALSVENIESGVRGPDSAYVLYTSGSTGRPKGVVVSHQALANLLWSMRHAPGLTETDTLAAVTTVSFDIAALEIFLPLVVGARIELVSRQTATDGVALARRLATSGATVLQATPATWRLLLEAGWQGARGLRAWCGGEALAPDLAAALLARVDELWNCYGPTETTVYSTVERVGAGPITIGRPIANTQIYVVDQTGDVVPVGVTGEIWIGGDGVAAGYHRRPELTAERFVADRFGDRPGARLYRTGDLGRWQPDGRLQYLGRIDHQVKIRGFRIELGEIETVLRQHPLVREAVVVATSVTPDEKRLVAYVVGNGPVVGDLREHLRMSVPDYMVPAAFVVLDQLPLTSSGKVDRNALLAPDAAGSLTAEESTAPVTAIEKAVAQIFADVLNIPTVGLHHNFFELGGHSLLATRALARLRDHFKRKIPLIALFEAPTVQGLSQWLEAAAAKAPSSTVLADAHLDPLPAWKCLVATQSNGSRPPLFLITGYMDADDTLRIMSNLIPHLGPDRQLCGLRPRWLDGVSPPYSSVEELADEYMTEVRAFQPQGPYYLLGDCLGGVVAVEVARKLLDRGDEVALLMLLDTERPRWHSYVVGRLVDRGRHIVGALRQFLRPTTGTRQQMFAEMLQRKLRRSWLSSSPVTRTDYVYEHLTAYQGLLRKHRLEPYPGHIKLILSADMFPLAKFLGWNGFAGGGMEFSCTPGDHETCRTQFIGELSQQIRQYLDHAQPESEERVNVSANVVRLAEVATTARRGSTAFSERNPA